jgi:hypothetical protein
MNQWQIIKNYINSKPIGYIITRPKLRNVACNGSPLPQGISHTTTVDNYRRCLTILGILELKERGKYKILHHIKEDITSSFLTKVAYSNDWRQWFADLKK